MTTLYNLFYLRRKNDKYFKYKIFLIIFVFVLLFVFFYDEFKRDIYPIPINISKDSIMRLLPDPRYIVPPPFINFYNQ